jgi:hypothetical protein
VLRSAIAIQHEALQVEEALPVRQEELKEELDDLLADQQATSSASSQSLGDYLDDDDDSDSDTIIDLISVAYQHDPHTRNLLENHNDNYRFEHDLIYVQNRLLVPNDDDIKEQIMQMCHDFKLSGHMGTAKTAELIKRYFYWKSIDTAVREYVLSCPHCQADKDTNQRKLGLLHSIEIPTRRWQVITVDFITALPEVIADGVTLNSICVFVDKYTKMVHLSPCNTKLTAPAFARMFMRDIVRLHGVPQRIISDRDTRFNNAFWKAFVKALNVDLAMSTAYHPQTDGQTERVNRVLQEMLRHYVYDHHELWHLRLPYAEFAINNTVSASTGHTPFYLNYGEHPATPLTHMIPNIDDVPQAADTISKIAEALDSARNKMEAAQRRQAYYANSSRREQTFNVGDKVWLRTANYMDRMRKHVAGNKQASLKLLPRYLGPLEITHKYSDLVYRLSLPAAWSGIHSVFHISQLQAYRESTRFKHSKPPPKAGPTVVRHALSAESVSAVLGRKYYGYTSELGHQYRYYVKWVGQPDSSNQWVQEDDVMRNGKHHPLLDKYDKEVPFLADEPKPGTHTQLTAAQKQTLYDRGNVSTGMTVSGNQFHSIRKKAARIPKKRH